METKLEPVHPDLIDIGQRAPQVPHFRAENSAERKGFANITVAILWLAAIVCAVIPFTVYLSPILFIAGLYYGWKILRRTA